MKIKAYYTTIIVNAGDLLEAMRCKLSNHA